MKTLAKDIFTGLCVFALASSMYVVFAVYDIPVTRGNRALGWLCIIVVAVLLDRWITGRKG